MEVTDGHFYLIQRGDDTSHVVDTEDEAIDRLRDVDDLDLDADADDPDIQIVRVGFEGEEWTIKELAWKRIAIKLLERDSD